MNSDSSLPPPVVLCGPPGSGKTMLLNSVLSSSKSILGDSVLVSTLSFSSSTSIESIMHSIEQYCEYRKSGDGWTLQPVSSHTSTSTVSAGGKSATSSSSSSLLSTPPWLVVFCDEINLPAADKYGTQRAISHIRNITESGGFWYPLRLETSGGGGGGGGGLNTDISSGTKKAPSEQHPNGAEPAWVSLKRVLFVGACNPPTDAGRVLLSNRFLRHAPIINVGYPSIDGLRAIYGTLISALVKQFPPLSILSASLTNACIDVYIANHERFSGKEPQCVYSPRELSRWVRAISEGLSPIARHASNNNTTTITSSSDAATMLVRLWLHEGLRLFSDRLSSDHDRKWVANTIDSVAQKYFFSISSSSAATTTTAASSDKSSLLSFSSSISVNLSAAVSRPVYFTDWLDGSYVSVTHEDALAHASRRAQSFMGESSIANIHQQLVVFDDALAYMLRIDRVLQQPLGHLLLAGASGAGKSLLTQFVCWMRGIATVSVRVSSRYTVADFDKDLRSVMMRTGAYREPLAFIFDEGNVLSSAFLERMNSLLASGEVPGLFEGEDKTMLLAACRSVWSTSSSSSTTTTTGSSMSSSSQAFAANSAAAASRLRAADLDNDDVILRIFTQNVQRFLHVVFTVNPATASFTNRKTTSPALFNRCVVVWMGDWSDLSRAQVASSLLSRMTSSSLPVLDSYCSSKDDSKYILPKALSQASTPKSDMARSMLGAAMLSRQRLDNHYNKNSITNTTKAVNPSEEYRFSDALSSLLSSLHSVTATLIEEITTNTGNSSVARVDSSAAAASARPFISPRDFIDMLNHFVSIFSEKQAHIEARVKHVSAGLSKIRATEATVASLQASLAVKQRGLTAKTEAANIKLAQMLTDQKEAERRRTDSMILRDQLAKMTSELATREATVASELSAAEPALKEAQLSVQSINKAQLDELRSLIQPPQPVKLCLEAVLALLGTASTTADDSVPWTEVRKVIKSTDFIPNVVKLRTDTLSAKVRQRVNDRYVTGAQNAKDFTFEHQWCKQGLRTALHVGSVPALVCIYTRESRAPPR